LRGEFIRRSLDLRNWEAATKLIRDWEVEGTAVSVTVSKAVDRFISDREALKLSDAMLSKYRRVTSEIKALFGDRVLRSVTTDDVRAMREKWKLAPITTQKRMEMVRKFFKFCVDSGWMEKNPAKGVETPTVIHDPTLPFTDLEMEKIIWAAESIREAHPRIPVGTHLEDQSRWLPFDGDLQSNTALEDSHSSWNRVCRFAITGWRSVERSGLQLQR